jgi:ABC-type transporter Mla subunit MlaD
MALTIEERVTALETAQNDTTQTLRWAVAKLGQIAAVQDQHTLRLERLETKIDGLTAEVRALPAAMAQTMAELIEASEKRMLAAIAGIKR